MIFAVAASACSRKPSAPASKAAPVRITQFYASPPNPPKGEKSLVCYGVENATDVRLDPPVERVWPSPSHCFDFTPLKETVLTLTAARGPEQAMQTITLNPGPPEAKLLQVSINKVEASAGDEITVCFKARNATRVALRPGKPYGPQSPEQGCVQDKPQRTTTYVVTATGAAGDIDTERVTVKVK